MKTIKRFCILFSVCFVVLLGTQLLDVRASSNQGQPDLISTFESNPVQYLMSSNQNTASSDELNKAVQPSEGEVTEGEEPPVEVTEGEEPPVEVTEGEEPSVEVTEGEEPSVEATEGEEPSVEATEGEEPSVEVTEEEQPSVEGVTDEAEASEEVADVYEYQFSTDNIQLLATDVNTLPFPIILRDFKADYFIFEGHIDGGTKGMVNSSLTDSKPTFTDKAIHDMVRNYDSSKVSETALADAKQFYEENKDKPYKSLTFKKTNNKYEEPYKYLVYHLNKLFVNVTDLNQSKEDRLLLTQNAQGTYEYLNSKYFPIDNELFGNQGNSHNYHFTLESHTKFWFDGAKTLTFNFTGDDDVWVYVNNQQVIDLGGVHSQQSQSFKIVPRTLADGTVVGDIYVGNTFKLTLNGEGWYDFDFFFMERHQSESNLKITTNMEFKPRIEIEKIPYMINSEGVEITLEPTNIVYPGETVYYKFKVKNAGNVDLENVVISDPLLGLTINAQGITKDGQAVNDYKITKTLGEQVSSGTLDDFKELGAANLSTPATELEIKSDDFSYVVTNQDVIEGKITNEAKVTAKHKNDEVIEQASATVQVGVEEVNPDIIKLQASVTKVIDSVKRNGESIQVDSKLHPGDVVTFKFTVTNNSISINPLTGEVSIAIDKLNLNDVLELDSYKKEDWKFRLENGEAFNHSDFSLPANRSITVWADWTVSEPSENDQDYTGSNTVTLSRKETELDKTSVAFEIERPQLRIKKEVIGMVDANQTFDIVIQGSDGTKFVTSLKAGEEKTVTGLFYNVTYTISEINVPSHYELDKISQSSIKLTKETKDTLITVTNIERPTLKITKTVIGEAPSDAEFKIKVSGSDGSQYNVRIKAGQTATLNDLSYGVAYTISEVVPMNYELVGISNVDENHQIIFDKNHQVYTVTVTNQKVNDKWFQDDCHVANRFNYTKTSD